MCCNITIGVCNAPFAVLNLYATKHETQTISQGVYVEAVSNSNIHKSTFCLSQRCEGVVCSTKIFHLSRRYTFTISLSLTYHI